MVPIPGASAVTAALAASGYPADSFVFAGFAPSKSNDRKSWLLALVDEPRTVVFFEAPHRIAKTLSDMAGVFGDRPIIVARELTKLHEQIVRTTAREATGAAIPEKGEFTIVLGPVAPSQITENVDDDELSSFFYQMTDERKSRRQAIAATA